MAKKWVTKNKMAFNGYGNGHKDNTCRSDVGEGINYVRKKINIYIQIWMQGFKSIVDTSNKDVH